MNIAPMNSRLIVSPVATEYEKTEGDIFVENDLSEGVVLEIAPELKDLYAVDDHVLYHKDGGQSQYYKGKSCLWLSQNEIWGIVTYDKISV